MVDMRPDSSYVTLFFLCFFLISCFRPFCLYYDPPDDDPMRMLDSMAPRNPCTSTYPTPRNIYSCIRKLSCWLDFEREDDGANEVA